MLQQQEEEVGSIGVGVLSMLRSELPFDLRVREPEQHCAKEAC